MGSSASSAPPEPSRACRSPRPLDRRHYPTADRGRLMEAIRRGFLRGEQTLSIDEHQALFTSTSLFERIIRLLRRLRVELGPPLG